MTSLSVAPHVARVHSVPPYATSAGHEAIELAASAGLLLDEWQQTVLIDALGERDDGRWASFEVALWVARQNGKGAILEARELAGLFLFGERLILHTAHEFKTSSEAFRRIKALILNTPDLASRVRRVSEANGEEGIELHGGQRLRFVARSKGSGRGFSADLVIWDEAQELQDMHVEAQLPTVSARPNPQLWYTGSPPRDVVAGATAVAIHRRGESGGDPNLCYYDFGAEPGADIDDVDVWRATNPGLGIRISLDSIARERRAMTPEGFARERLGVWPPEAGEQWAVIPETDWARAYDRHSTRTGALAFAVEMSMDRLWSVIAVAGMRADGLRHVEIVDSRPGPAWVVDRLRELVKRWRPCAVVIRPNGPAGTLIADIEAAGIELAKITATDEAQAAALFTDGVSGRVGDDGADPRVVRHIGQGVLTVAVAGAVRRNTGNAWTWDRRSASVDIAPLIAGSNALWALGKFGAKVAPAPWVAWA